MTVTAADILERAAEVLEIGGHCRGEYGSRDRDDTPHCAVGAIRRAGKALGVYNTEAGFRAVLDAEKAVDAELRRVLPIPDDSDIYDINDDPKFRMGVTRWAALNRRVAKQLREAE